MVNWTRSRPRPNKANFRPDGNGQGSARLPMTAVGPTVRNKANPAGAGRTDADYSGVKGHHDIVTESHNMYAAGNDCSIQMKGV